MRKTDLLTNSLVSIVAGGAGALIVLVLTFSVAQNQHLFAFPALDSFKQMVGGSKQPAVSVATANPGDENSVTSAVKKTNPAVVSIIISQDVPIMQQYYDTQPSNPNDPFGDFFNFQVPQYRQNGTQKQEVGGGSGFFVSSDGLIVTNKHVVDQTDAQYTVLTNDGKKYDAHVIARDPINDLAVIKVTGATFPFLQFGNSDSIQVGQTAIAIGNALGEYRNTVSVGVISGLSRSITAGDTSGQSESLEGIIQTDAAINPGNSGGPLLDTSGQVVGVNVAIAQGSQSVGFAIPSNVAKKVVDSVEKTGKIVRPYLGVRYLPITQEVQDANKLSVNYGVLIQRGSTPDQLAVIPGSPADKAGLQENDIILEADGTKLDDTHSLATLVANKAVGDTITLKIIHRGAEKTITVTLEEAQQ